MSIGLRNIDPEIAERIRIKLGILRTMGFEDHQHPHAPGREADLAARDVLQRRDPVPFVMRWAASLAMGFTVLIAVAQGVNSGAIPGPFVIAGPALGGLTYYLSWWMNKRGRINDLDAHMQSVEVRAASAIIDVTPSERSYLESIALLLDLQPSLDRQTGKDILTELNMLMGQSHKLDAYRSNLVAAINAESPDALIAQREELRARLSRTSDSAAKSAFEQSIELIDSRCRVAETLRPGLERVEAQQEVIEQTLASVQSSLARMKVAPAELTVPDLALIRESISEVTGQTQAVEEAVQEVMALRSG